MGEDSRIAQKKDTLLNSNCVWREQTTPVNERKRTAWHRMREIGTQTDRKREKGREIEATVGAYARWTNDSVTCYEITIRSAAVHPRVTRIRGSSIYLSTIRFTWTLFTTLEGGKRLLLPLRTVIVVVVVKTSPPPSNLVYQVPVYLAIDDSFCRHEFPADSRCSILSIFFFFFSFHSNPFRANEHQLLNLFLRL